MPDLLGLLEGVEMAVLLEGPELLEMLADLTPHPVVELVCVSASQILLVGISLNNY